MKAIIKIFLFLAVITATLQACKKAGGNYPGDEYTWDMNHSLAYETYALNPLMEDSMGALLPVAGTIPYTGNAMSGERNAMQAEINLPYQYANTPEGYERAGIEVTNPLTASPEILLEGKHYFDIYCAVCHGVAGDGKGIIVTEGKYTAAPPSYFDPAYLSMSDGKMFHSINYGKNAMQSYAYALSKEERWKVITYINSLQNEYIMENNIVVATATVDASKTK